MFKGKSFGVTLHSHIGLDLIFDGIGLFRPPGTGKSTFLVNVICQRLAKHPNSRLLVTAPTNKAVTVLAERFMDVVNNGDDDLSCKCNAVLVGVEEKLISPSSKSETDYFSAESLSSRLA